MIENGCKHQLNILPSSKINIISLLRMGGIHRHKTKSQLRANVNMHQTNSGKSPKFVFSPLTMTNKTESTESLSFKIKKDGYKVTVKIFLCNCVVLS